MKKGFTFIEVASVLAIAGLIFAMVFVALPALQRSSRDTIRRDDLTDFIAAVKKYQTNNRGALPGGTDNTYPVLVDRGEIDEEAEDTTWEGFYNKYLGDDFVDPNGEAYNLRVVACGESAENPCVDVAQLDSANGMDYTLLVVTQATCSNDKSVASSNPRNLAVLYRLEGSGIACANT